jgi:branched-chain amino acid aminotransferase
MSTPDLCSTATATPNQPFDASALLTLIRRLVALEARWIPRARGCSLYIRPTLIGTRPSLGVSASRHAALYVICSPTGPYIRATDADSSADRGISLLAMSDQVRAWPGGTGGFKLGLNYAPGFVAQRAAAAMGYQQLLWLLGETVAEAGAMNVFAVFERPDGGACPPSPPFNPPSVSAHSLTHSLPPSVSTALDIVTPPLDGTILPGVTRASVLSLLTHRPHTAALPKLLLPQALTLHTSERALTMSELFAASASGTLREVFCVGTAAVVIPAARIGWQCSSSNSSASGSTGGGGGDGDVEAGKEAVQVQDIVLPVVGGEGSVAHALWERLVDIQEGNVEWEGWGVPCHCAVADADTDDP